MPGSLARNNKAPATHIGATKNTTGNEPNNLFEF